MISFLGFFYLLMTLFFFVAFVLMPLEDDDRPLYNKIGPTWFVICLFLTAAIWPLGFPIGLYKAYKIMRSRDIF